MSKPTTNTDKVLDMMSSYRYGAISELAMVQVINIGLHSVLKGIDDSTDPIWGLINRDAFKGAVEEIKEKFAEHYE
jgi:hypothetical protein